MAQADAPQGSASLVPNLPSGQQVGVTVTWSALATGVNTPLYRFSVAPAGGSYRILQDFSPSNTFTWTPMQEGSYNVEVTVEDGYTSTSSIDDVAPFMVTSRVTGTTAVVSPTANPLVALYSAPPCSAGQTVVMFRAVSDSSWTYTAAQSCQPGESLNFFVAGMHAGTTYLLQHMVSGPAGTTISAPQSFTTGTPTSALSFPSFSVPQAPDPQADLDMPVIFHLLTPSDPSTPNPLATDLSGNVVWYYDPSQSGLTSIWPTQLVPGGTVLLLGRDVYASSGFDVLREIDLAGDTVRETNLAAVNAQLAARGQEQIYGFHHDAVRLPNGDTAVLGQTQQTIDGADIMGDMVVVLDGDFQVVWTWDAFDYLDPSRSAILGETCAVADPGFCAVPDPNAEDWLHTNKIGWSPADNDLTLSLRSQDWVIKIDYANGAGDGHVVWRLGQGGDFSLTSTDPYPWFSHQHDAHYIDATTLALFDNGDTRCATAPPPCDSRGQVYALGEQNHVATLLLNVDLGSYSQVLGSAERLPNGNFVFTSGAQPGPIGQSIEVSPAGTKVYVQQINTIEYRSYRVADLYSGTDPQSAPCTDAIACATPTGTSTSTPVPATNTPTDTNTPVPAPTNTPITPPSRTPVTAPSSTPSGEIATPSPTATATRPVTGTPTTAATAAALPRRKPSGHSYPLRVAVSAPHGTIVGKGIVVVDVSARPRTAVTLTAQLHLQQKIAAKSRVTTRAAQAKQRGQKTKDTVVYHAKVRARTGAKGRAVIRLRLTYNPAQAVHALFEVIVQTRQGKVMRSIHVVVRPAPAHSASSHHTVPAKHSAKRRAATALPRRRGSS